MSPSSVEAVPALVLVLIAWAAVTALVAFLLYRLAKAAINKTDARDVPRVLSAFAELVKCFTGTRGQGLTIPPQGVLGLSAPAAADAIVTEQTSQQGISGTEAAA